MANETQAQAPSPQAEAVGEHVTQEIAAAQSETAAVIDGAAAQVDAANNTAQDIARAAMQTDLGRQFESLRSEVATWQDQFQARVQEVQEDNMAIQDGLTAALARLTEALTPQPAPPPPPPPPTPSASTPTPQPLRPATPHQSEGAGAHPDQPASPPKPKRRAI